MIDLTLIFQAFIALIATIITVIIIPYIKNKTSNEEREKLEKWIGIAVAAAEQIYIGSGQGEAKKLYVVNFLAEKGFTVSTGEIATSINALIEAAVYALNN